MLRWLKEFWKECPWYGFLFLGLSAVALSDIRTNNLVASPVGIPAWVALVYLSKRWGLLGNRVFHLLAGLASLLAVLLCLLVWPQELFRAFERLGDAEDSCRNCAAAATGALAALSLLALTPLRRELRPWTRAARLGACAFLAALASFGLVVLLVAVALLFIHTVILGKHL